MRIRVFVAVLLLLAAPAVAAAYDLIVNPFHSCSLSGTPEYLTLQDAVTAANPGDQIGVCPGTYDQTVTVSKPVTFTAIGYVLINPSWVQGKACFDIEADGVTVRYFVIKGCDVAITIAGNEALIQNNQLQYNGTGILITSAENFIVQNNLIQDTAGTGISVTGLSDGTIKNNTLQGGGTGILVAAPGVIVNKNSVQHFGSAGIEAFGAPAADCTISFNSVSFNGLGILLTSVGSGNQVSRNVVTRNAVLDCSWDSSGAVSFSKNTCGTEVPAGIWD
jgi:parallel beta-helix repeat protein